MAQADKEDVEDLGLLKLDVPGVRMQSAGTARTCRSGGGVRAAAGAGRGTGRAAPRLRHAPLRRHPVRFLETEHFGVRYKRRSSHVDLTDVPQRWLRDLFWERCARRLRSLQAPRSPQHIDAGRRVCVDLGVCLTVTAPGSGHDPALLAEDHMRRFVADQNKRARERLPSVAVRRDGRPMTGSTRSRAASNGRQATLEDAQRPD
jgi:hypothetical protein